MARKPEAQYTSSVGKKLPASVYPLKLCLPYTAGVPDSYYEGNKDTLWVEYKYLDRIPGTVDLVGGKHPIVSKLQQEWLRRAHRNGRQVAVIVGSRIGGVIYSGLSWELEISKADFERLALTKQKVADWIATTVLQNIPPD